MRGVGVEFGIYFLQNSFQVQSQADIMTVSFPGLVKEKINV